MKKEKFYYPFSKKEKIWLDSMKKRRRGVEVFWRDEEENNQIEQKNEVSLPVLEWKHPPAVKASNILLQSVIWASSLQEKSKTISDMSKQSTGKIKKKKNRKEKKTNIQQKFRERKKIGIVKER